MPALLSLVGIGKRFGGVDALRDITLDIEPGTIVAVIGPNGAGKTTLFDVISGLTRPTTGAVRVDGSDITTLSPHRRAWRGIGRTFQIARLFPNLSVHDNVLVGVTFARGASGERNPDGAARMRTRDHRARVERLLARVGLSDKAGARARELSLGEQKRLELACALGPAPRLLLLDELTSGLPPRGQAEVTRFYGRLRARGVTIVAVEHSFALLLELADRVVVLEQGRIVADGSPRDVFASPRVAQAYGGEEPLP